MKIFDPDEQVPEVPKERPSSEDLLLLSPPLVGHLAQKFLSELDDANSDANFNAVASLRLCMATFTQWAAKHLAQHPVEEYRVEDGKVLLRLRGNPAWLHLESRLPSNPGGAA